MMHHGALWAAAFWFGSMWLCLVLIWVLHVFTVRRLRRIPALRGRLGFSILPGGDAMNVALALSWPRRLMRLLDTSVTGWCFAHADSVYRYTSRGEKWLARTCYASLVLSLLALALASALYRWA